MRLILSVFCLLLSASGAQSGAWSREKGETFVASSGNFLLSEGAELPVHYDPTFYLEYGFNDRVTVGIDYHTADRSKIQTGLIFASFPLGDIAAINRFAASLAFGARVDAPNPVETLTRCGLSWGRSTTTGWLAIDATATYGTVDQAFRPKVDFTWGYNMTDRWTGMLQLQSGQGYSDDYYAKISPSISFGITKDIRLSVGAVKALTGDEGSALKIDIWSTF